MYNNDNNIFNSIENLYNMNGDSWREVLATMYNNFGSLENAFRELETNFGLRFPEEVKIRIETLIKDGTLGNLINNKLLGDINKKVEDTKEELTSRLADITYYVTPEMFGAKGDGLTDDTQAIQNAINSLTAGGTVNFAPKSYKITSYLSVTDNIVLHGAGFNTIILIPTNTIGGIQNKSWEEALANKNIIIQNLRIKYNTPLTITQGDERNGAWKGHGIRFRNTKNIIIDKVFVENAPISGIDFSGCSDIQVKDCLNNLAGQGFITATTSKNININGNVITAGLGVNIYDVRPTGIDIGETCSDVVINGNTIYDCYYGIYCRDNTERVNINGNTIKNCTDGIASVIETVGFISIKDLAVSNNIVEQCSRTGIDLRSTRSGIISNNIVKNIAEHGIWILSLNEDLIIKGNNVSYCGKHGINHADKNNLRTVISDNVCYHNGTSGSGFAGIYNKGDTQIINNICNDNTTNPTQDYGITSEQLTPTINNNVVYQNKVANINITAGGSRGINRENYDLKPTKDTLLDLGSTWNGTHIKMGNYHLWLDSQVRLRVKNGAPTSDVDGMLVGTQQ